MNQNYLDVFVTIATKKVEVAVNFYSQLLQQEPTIYRSQTYAEFQLKTLRIAIFQPKTEHQAEFGDRNSAISFCFEVENLDQAIALISDLGYPPPGEIIEASHGREVYAYDPDGNRLILHQSPNR